jgi:hypothetical protein
MESSWLASKSRSTITKKVSPNSGELLSSEIAVRMRRCPRPKTT